MSGYACIMYIRGPRGLIDVENKKDGNSRATFYLIYVDMNQWVHIYNGVVESLFNVTVYLRIKLQGYEYSTMLHTGLFPLFFYGTQVSNIY